MYHRNNKFKNADVTNCDQITLLNKNKSCPKEWLKTLFFRFCGSIIQTEHRESLSLLPNI